MRIRKRSLTAAALALCVATLSACGSSTPSTVAKGCKPIAQVKTATKGVLTASIAEFPPYIGAKDGKPTGVDGVLLTKIAAATCLDLKVNVTSFPAITSSLQQGTSDLSAGSWTINTERKSMFDVSDPVYKSLAAVVSKSGISTVNGMEGKKVGTTTGYLWVSDLQKAIGGNNVKLYQSEQAVYDDLKAGRIDAGLVTEGAVASYMAKDGNADKFELKVLEKDPRLQVSVNPPVAGVLIHKGDAGLLKAVNIVVKKYQTSGDLATQLKDAGISEQSVIGG